MLAAVLAGATFARAEAGSSERDQQYAAWRDTYYGANVIEYCGLVSEEVKDGFRRKVRFLRAWSELPPAIEWRIRVWAAVRADYQYLDHSLGGHRIWCESDGLTAVRSFLAFRERELAKEAGE
ncbi:hypothetical protein FRZ61_24370 [Hypericibacter adhaerens]|uniref:Uncharacterized protein n=1 Tax=Hypericibacter adhaerens TaxID=2602016 RepID=A0A5J6N0M9_9PROT|nr:hypothetical protein FRZ61_24370 [Hypericibacter adhaerens]